MTKTTQVNVALPNKWKEQLERLARIFSVEKDKNISYQDLIRMALKEKYQLNEQEEQIQEN
jgi:hypothetical protein